MNELLILIGLVLLNGLFVIAEIALVSARKARLESQANKGDLRAKAALDLANHPDKFLSTTQIGITLIAILTGFYSGEKIIGQFKEWLLQFPSISKYAGGISTVLVLTMVTYLSLVLGELVPKRLGLTAPEAIAKFVAAPMKVFTWLTYPFGWLLTRTANILMKLFKINTRDNQVTEEEIKAIISEGTEHGALEATEQEIIDSTSSSLRASVAISCASCRPADAVVRPTCISATGLGASSRNVVCPLSTALRMPWVK